MTVHEAIQYAQSLLPGEPAAEDQEDTRWQAIISVGEHIETEPQAVWEFVRTWGVHPQEDLRTAIGTCLLEHLLEYHFDAYFPAVERLAEDAPLFADTFLNCWKFGQSTASHNAARFDRLRERLRKPLYG